MEMDRITTNKVIEDLKDNTAKKTMRVKESEGANLGIYESKFGGLPYWEEKDEYPTDKNGNQLILLAQINFEKTPIEDERFPKQGILQFFVGTDDLNGADFDDLTNQSGFRVIYHENIESGITREDIRSQGIRSNSDLDGADGEYFPFYKEYEIEFEEDEEPISIAMEDFETELSASVEAVTGEGIEDMWDDLPAEEADYISETCNGAGHKVLGYPYFTQYDPRGENGEYNGKEYDTLLLQIDSIGDIMWGDSGIANFFINEQDLINKNFDDVLYTWDCC